VDNLIKAGFRVDSALYRMVLEKLELNKQLQTKSILLESV